VRTTAEEYGIDRKIRFQQRVKRASWSSAEARWTVEVERGPSQERSHLTCNFLFLCSGYYNYEAGYTPEFPGIERFAGRIVHPQKWTDDIAYQGKRVVVIGSGATAVTLVPALAKSAAQVTMLQRSPSYVLSLPGQDGLANALRHWLPAGLAYGITRWKNVILGMLVFQLSRRAPDLMRKLIRAGVKAQLAPGYDVDTHFNPRYNPWDQRMCLVPDGDLFRSIRKGEASVVTDEIETFTEKGLQLKSGAELEADLNITATGLDLVALGGIEVSVDGAPIEAAKTLSYKGMMLSGVPNLAVALGYTNASWTLKCDLTCAYVCRLLNFMAKRGYRQVTPRNDDPTIEAVPFIDFSSGYIQRAIHKFPKQGSRAPWRLYQNYAFDIVALRFGALEDGALEFSGAERSVEAVKSAAA
ncbi:MAG: flavin-containing monooxygenase, partial [Gaiellales bacterium]